MEQPRSESSVPPGIDGQDQDSAARNENEETAGNDQHALKVARSRESKEKTPHCKPEQTPWWRKVLETSAFLVGVGVALIYWRQLDQMIQSNKLTRESIDKTTSAVEVDQRPYLVAMSPAFNKPGFVASRELYAHATVKNVGRTPAISKYTVTALAAFPFQMGDPNTVAQAYKTFIDSVFNKVEGSESTTRAQLGTLGYEEDIAPGGEYFTQNGVPVTLSPAEFNDIGNGGHTSGALFFVGLITYADILTHPHRTEFCWYHIGTDPNNWIRCKSHNIIR